MTIVDQQYGMAKDASNSDVIWLPTRERAETWAKSTSFPDAHLVVRDIGPARNVDAAPKTTATESPDFTAHANQALGLDA